MARHYRHLSLDERNKLGILQGEGKSIRNIAKIMIMMVMQMSI